MKRHSVAVLSFSALFVTSAVALAISRGTPDEARAMLDKAVSHYASVGRKQALSDFTAAKPPYKDRDLYVVCVASDHKILANGGFPDFVGTSADSLKDAEGHPLGKALWDAAAKQKSGYIHYPMVNPLTRQVEQKTTFFSRLEDDLLCGVGVYSPS